MVDNVMLRLGGVCAILGALAVTAGTFLHPDLPSPKDGSLAVVAANDAWHALHLTPLLGALLCLGAFVVLARDLDRQPTMAGGASAGLAWLGVVAAVVGAGVVAVDMTLDGVGLKNFADTWAASPLDEQAALLRVAEGIFALVTSLYVASIALFLGLPFLLFGLATARSGRYPAWLGWFGAAGGLGLLAIGCWLFVGGPLFLLAFLALLSAIPITWLLAMGTLLWRRAGGGRPARLAEANRGDQIERGVAR
jgi:hypothetical protein